MRGFNLCSMGIEARTPQRIGVRLTIAAKSLESAQFNRIAG